MQYALLGSNIDKEVTSLKSSLSTISINNFDGFWIGPAHDNLTNRLNIAIKNLENQLMLASSYANALKNIDFYISKGQELSKLQYKSNTSEINAIQAQRTTIKQSITNTTSTIKEYTPQETTISYNG